MLPRWFLAFPLAILAASCTTTPTYHTTWRAPDAGPIDYAGKTVAAIFISAEESTRRVAEDALARELSAHGTHGVAAYTIVPLADLKDEAGARVKLRAAGCDGAVVMRVTARELEITSYPGAYSGFRYSTFSSYSCWGWSMAYDPGYVRSDTVLTIETLVYGLEDDKLLWAGTSESIEPSSIERHVIELARAAAEEMKKVGLLR